METKDDDDQLLSFIKKFWMLIELPVYEQIDGCLEADEKNVF